MFRGSSAPLLVVALWLVGSPEPSAAQTTLTIRVLNLADTSGSVLTDAFAIADDVWQTAGITLAWRACDRPGTCPGPLGPEELWLRVAPGVARDDGRLTPETLSYSVVGAGPGTLATVFVERVTDRALQGGLFPHELLGIIVAHEVADLVLQTPSSPRRLSRKLWTVGELRWLFREGLQFSAAEGAALRSAIVQRMTTD